MFRELRRDSDDEEESPMTNFPKHLKTRRSFLPIVKDILILVLAFPAIIAMFRGNAQPVHGHGHDQHEMSSHAKHENMHMNHDSHQDHHDHEHNHQKQTSAYAADMPTSCDCGANTREALSLGCKYDSLAAAWLPPHCRDDELTAEFERSGDGPNGTWTYWADTAHTQPLTLDEVALLADTPERRFHMSNHWHVVHCIFYWRKEHRFRFTNGQKIVEPRSDSEHHIKHCGEMFLGHEYGTISGVALNTDEE